VHQFKLLLVKSVSALHANDFYVDDSEIGTSARTNEDHICFCRHYHKEKLRHRLNEKIITVKNILEVGWPVGSLGILAK
jgi:hypothetical protein